MAQDQSTVDTPTLRDISLFASLAAARAVASALIDPDVQPGREVIPLIKAVHELHGVAGVAALIGELAVFLAEDLAGDAVPEEVAGHRRGQALARIHVAIDQAEQAILYARAHRGT